MPEVNSSSSYVIYYHPLRPFYPPPIPNSNACKLLLTSLKTQPKSSFNTQLKIYLTYLRHLIYCNYNNLPLPTLTLSPRFSTKPYQPATSNPSISSQPQPSSISSDPMLMDVDSSSSKLPKPVPTPKPAPSLVPTPKPVPAVTVPTPKPVHVITVKPPTQPSSSSSSSSSSSLNPVLTPVPTPDPVPKPKEVKLDQYSLDPNFLPTYCKFTQDELIEDYLELHKRHRIGDYPDSLGLRNKSIKELQDLRHAQNRSIRRTFR
eukprot:Pompholyxophrys_punicea_v1_NODE_630_length_1560_cov_15.691030.p1 type:complete len:261 gc:universal NODE_630_length_1560_cov_15.691030:1082-300(-)